MRPLQTHRTHRAAGDRRRRSRYCQPREPLHV